MSIDAVLCHGGPAGPEDAVRPGGALNAPTSAAAERGRRPSRSPSIDAAIQEHPERLADLHHPNSVVAVRGIIVWLFQLVSSTVVQRAGLLSGQPDWAGRVVMNGGAFVLPIVARKSSRSI